MVKEPGLGAEAFRYENIKESLGPLTDQQVTAAWPAMADAVRTLLPKLRS